MNFDIRKYLLPGLMFFFIQTHGENVSINGSCAQSIVILANGGDASLPTFNSRPVYYNASVLVNYASTLVNVEAYLYYESAANLGTAEDRWVVTYDGQPYYYSISASMNAPIGNYLPFDPLDPVANCGGSISVAPSFALPVQLLSATAYAKEENNLIQWETVIESNNNYFEIERSANAKDFSIIGKVSSKVLGVNSSAKNLYQFADEQPFQQHSYYLITQTDMDGKRQVISKVMDVFRKSIGSVYLFPNPAKDDLTIVHSFGEKIVSYSIQDPCGRIVSSEYINETKVHIYLSHLTSGCYSLRTSSADNEQQTFKLIIQ